MSINLNISFEVHNIKEIHDEEDETKRNELYKAAKKFLDDEGILDQDMIVDFLEQDGYLAAYTTFPIVVSRSYLWVPDVTERWAEMATKIVSPACKPLVQVEYPDEE